MANISSGKVRKSVKGPKHGGGSRKGIPNKATQTAREAFKQLVEGNAPTMHKWLMEVANGLPLMENVIENEVKIKRQVQKNGLLVWIVPPAPDKALDIMQKMAEYHIPKLARTEVVGDPKFPVLNIYKWQDD